MQLTTDETWKLISLAGNRRLRPAISIDSLSCSRRIRATRCIVQIALYGKVERRQVKLATVVGRGGSQGSTGVTPMQN